MVKELMQDFFDSWSSSAKDDQILTIPINKGQESYE